MSIFSIENFFVNSSFCTLFGTTLFYWGQFIFFQPAIERTEIRSIGTFGLIFGNIQLFAFLICRWFESHHFPLSNLYESLIFLSWSLTIGYFLIPTKSKFLVGAIIAPSAFFVNAFASLTLPDNLKISTPLVPALQSNWLMMHVTMMIISYSMLIVGSLFSIAILILSESQFSIQSEVNQIPNQNQLQETLKLFDNLSYRTIGFGFPLLTIGILSGAVWANQAWGSYWSWDPKETWALITWFIFAIYFHFRFNKKLSGKQPALIASIGFIFLWICYLGVNILGKGLHSYGWF